MKIKQLYFLGVCAMFLGCNDVDDGSFVEPITLYEKVNGSWYLMNLKMTDEIAKSGGLTPVDQNISSYFNFPDFMITLNVDEKNRPTTYEVSGDVPALFLKKGYWALSNDFQLTGGEAVKLYLYKDAAKSQKIDELNFVSVPGGQKEMELQLKRTSGGTPFVSYNYKLKAFE